MPIDFLYKDAEVNRENLKRDPFEKLWKIKEGSILLMDKIEGYCENPSVKLIYPFDKGSLKTASYRLSLGKACRVDGIDKELNECDPLLVIPPHGIAMVETYEWINMPGYLIGRWNLDSHRVYKGLVWVGGPQVDPGFQGHLSCPIYNLSSTPQKLRYKDPVFIIDFVRTNFFNEKKVTLWEKNRSTYSPAFGPLDEDRIMSAPRESLLVMAKDIQEMREQIKDNLQDNRKFQSIIWTAITIIITSIAILATIGATKVVWDKDWIPALLAFFALAISLISLIIAIFKDNRKSKSKYNKGDKINKG
jgi:deoxycytidine triphosphate deaminase